VYVDLAICYTYMLSNAESRVSTLNSDNSCNIAYCSHVLPNIFVH